MKFKVTFLLANVFFATSLANTPLPSETELAEPPMTFIDSSTQPKPPRRNRNPDHYCRRPNASCVQLGCFYDHCDFDSDIEKITRICHDVWNDGCIRTLCNKRGDCSMINRFLKYATLCGNGNN